MDYISALKELCSHAAVSGHEGNLAAYIKRLFGNYCDSVNVDRFFNVVGIKKGLGKKGKRVMVMAHFDEVGFMVRSIEEKGFVRFTNIGGIDSKILLAQEVIIHGRKDVAGIIGAKPPHLLKPEEAKKPVKVEELYIDTGMVPEKLKENVSIGDLITFKSIPFELQGGKVSSKSMDNRCGVVVLLMAIEELAKVKHEMDVYFVASTQEEVGSRGALIAAYNLSPDAAVIVDACHGDVPDAPRDQVFPLGKGPAIGIGPNLHRKATNRMMDIAREENIPYQVDVEPDDTGTDAWVTQVSRSGIPSVLVSIPVRYMHTPAEMLHMADIRNAGKLVARFVSQSEADMEGILCC